MIKKRMQSSRPQRSRTGDHHHQQNQGQQQGSRSNPRQLIEKYKTMAREAASMGDRVEAERYYQLADHYYRVTLASQPLRPEVQAPQVQAPLKSEGQAPQVQAPLKPDVPVPPAQAPVAAQVPSEPVQTPVQVEPVIEEDTKVTPS